MGFIEDAAKIIQEIAPKYGIKCYSAPLAQFILESACGTSELAVNAHNYAGLKYRKGRCPTAIGVYNKVGSEQDSTTGKYVSSSMDWFKFANMRDGIIGYFDFINISNYSNLKGITDPQKYLETIKADKYCTSINYVQNCMNVIKKYNLTQYDESKSTNSSNIKYYRVNVASCKNKSNAEMIRDNVKRKGFDAIIKYIDGFFKVQVGCFSKKENAEKLMKEIKANGFNAFVIYQ